MNIQIEIRPTKLFESEKGFDEEMNRLLENLELVILKSCFTRKAYSIGAGALLDSQGTIAAVYNIGSDDKNSLHSTRMFFRQNTNANKR